MRRPFSTSARRACVAVILGAALSVGCEKGATQLVVVVDSDFPQDSPLSQVEIRVQVPGSEARLPHETVEIGPGGTPLPFSFGIVPPSGRSQAEARIELRGLDASRTLLTAATARAGFVEHQALLLPMVLWRACEGAMCGEGETCDASSGSPVCVPELQEGLIPIAAGHEFGHARLDGGAPADAGSVTDAAGSQDAGPAPLDASTCGPELCNGLDDDCDGMVDDPTGSLCASGQSCRDARCGFFGDAERGWSYGTPMYDAIRALALDPGGNTYAAIYTVTTGARVLAVSYDPVGGERWRYGVPAGTAAQASSVAFDPRGRIYLVGSFSGAVNFGGGARVAANGGAFVLALDAADGSYLWDRWFTGTAPVVAKDVHVDSRGRVAVVGSHQGQTDFGLGPLPSSSGRDAYVVTLDGDDGSTDWVRSFGGSGSQDATDVAIGPDDQILVGGTFDGDLEIGSVRSTNLLSDVFVASLAREDGVESWVEWFGGPRQVSLGGISASSTTLVASGGFATNRGETVDFGGGARTSSGQSDIFVVGLDVRTGTHSWDRTIGSIAQDHATAVATGTGTLFVTGKFSTTVSFGGMAHTSEGSSDGFVLSLRESDGSYRWDQVVSGAGATEPFAIAASATNESVVTGAFEVNARVGSEEVTATANRDGFLFRLRD